MRRHGAPRPAPSVVQRCARGIVSSQHLRVLSRPRARYTTASSIDALGNRILTWPADQSQDLLRTVKQIEARGTVLEPTHLSCLVSRLAAHQPQDALIYLKRLQTLGGRLHGVTLSSAIHAHVNVGDLDKAVELFSTASAGDLKLAADASSSQLAAYGSLVHNLCRARRVAEAISIVKRLREALPSSAVVRLSRLYESLVMGAGLTGDLRFAWSVYTFMQENAVPLSPAGLTWLIRALLAPASALVVKAEESAQWRTALQATLNEARRAGTMTPGVWGALLAVQGDVRAPLEEAERSYQELTQWIASSWRPPGRADDAAELRRAMRHMMRAYALRGHGAGATGVMRDMVGAGLSLHVDDYTVLFELCAHEPALRASAMAARLLRAMQKRGHRPDRPAWLQALAALARGGCGAELLSLWRERQRETWVPTPLERVTVVRGLVNAGLWSEAVGELRAAKPDTPPLSDVVATERDALSPLAACVYAHKLLAMAPAASALPPLSAVVSVLLHQPPPRLLNVDMLLRGLGAERAPDAAHALYEHALREQRLRPADLLAAAEAQLMCGRADVAGYVLRAALARGWRPDAAAALLLRGQYAGQRIAETVPGLEALLPPLPSPPPLLVEFVERTEARSRHRSPKPQATSAKTRA